MNQDQHQRYQSQMVDLAHGELSSWDTFLLRWHIALCPACRREWAEVERLWGSLRQLSPTVSSRLRLKGKAMQVRVALAVSTAVICIVGGSVASRILSPRQIAPAVSKDDTAVDMGYECSIPVGSIDQFWYAKGEGRGKLQIYDAAGKQVRTLDISGRGTAESIKVQVRSLKNKTTLDEFPLRLLQRYNIRDVQGQILSSVAYVPFTEAEEMRYQKEESEDRARLVDIYRNPACVTLDTTGKTGGGYIALPGLFAWCLDVMRDESGTLTLDQSGKVQHLDSAGLAWKVIGHARITMTLLTTPKPYTRHYSTSDAQSQAQIRVGCPEIIPYIPTANAIPQIHWSQSAPAPDDTALDFNFTTRVANGKRYWIGPNGAWHKAILSGVTTGYGKHTIKDVNGKPLMILDVQPL